MSERMAVGLDSGDQEDEHSCFSDTTHQDFVYDMKGIENVWTGQYPGAEGPGMRALVTVVDPTLAAEVDGLVADATAKIAVARRSVGPGAGLAGGQPGARQGRGRGQGPRRSRPGSQAGRHGAWRAGANSRLRQKRAHVPAHSFRHRGGPARRRSRCGGDRRRSAGRGFARAIAGGSGHRRARRRHHARHRHRRRLHVPRQQRAARTGPAVRLRQPRVQHQMGGVPGLGEVLRRARSDLQPQLLLRLPCPRRARPAAGAGRADGIDAGAAVGGWPGRQARWIRATATSSTITRSWAFRPKAI